MVKPRITRREWRNVIPFALLIIAPLLILFPVIQVDAHQEKSAELLYLLDDHLYLANVVTGKTIALPGISTLGGSISDWSWSPNGRYLLDNYYPPESNKRFIRIYDVDNQRWLKNINVEAGYFDAWSSDSTEFSYSKSVMGGKYERERGEIWIFNLVTGQKRFLYQTVGGTSGHTDSWIGDMWWSPDDQHMLFEVYYPSHTEAISDLFLISTAGGAPSPFPAYHPSTLYPLWSPDSNWIAFKIPQPFHPEHDFIGDLYVYNLARNQRYTLTNTTGVDEQNARWSSDSQQIQFESGDQLVTVKLQAVVDNPEAFEQIVSALPKPKRFSDFSDWQHLSPDGQFIAFFKHDPQNLLDLYVVRPDGSGLRKLATLKDLNFLGWRPSK